jgi:hypothetical protein
MSTPPGWVRAIWLEPIAERYRYELRRHSVRSTPCPGPYRSFHNADAPLGDHGADFAPMKTGEGRPVSGDVGWSREDPRWPKECAHCEYVFVGDDAWQLQVEQLYSRSDGADVCTLSDAPIGAIWNAPWMAEWNSYRGPDGRSLWARCPGGNDWGIDSRASNCDSPCKVCGVPYHAHKGITVFNGQHSYEDARPEHKCWVRHGEPPELHVDKNGPTCGAGAGSIQTSNWHGFLHNGWFRA